MTRFRFLPILFAALFAGIVLAARQPEETPRQEETQQEEETKPPANQDPDAVARRDFMRMKLMYSQLILEGLTTDDFEMVDSAIGELELVTGGELWVAFEDDEEYRQLTDDFRTATARLKRASSTKNIDATAMRFYQMSTTCIDCHKHIRSQGYKL